MGLSINKLYIILSILLVLTSSILIIEIAHNYRDNYIINSQNSGNDIINILNLNDYNEINNKFKELRESELFSQANLNKYISNDYSKFRSELLELNGNNDDFNDEHNVYDSGIKTNFENKVIKLVEKEKKEKISFNINQLNSDSDLDNSLENNNNYNTNDNTNDNADNNNVDNNNNVSDGDLNKRLDVIISVDQINETLRQNIISLNGQIIKVSNLSRILLVNINLNRMEEFSNITGVLDISENKKYEPLLLESIPALKSDYITNGGFTSGNGIKVAILDTGIAEEGIDILQNRIILEQGFLDNSPGSPTNVHGTDVASILVSVAPEVLILNGKVFDNSGNGGTFEIIDGIDWAIENDADVISMSFGSQGNDEMVNDAIDLAIANNIIVISGSGNCGPCGFGSVCTDFVGVTSPGNYEPVITVGAVDDNLDYACYSSGEAYTDYLKPDLAAPGDLITTPAPDGATRIASGTSFSTPHISGVVALLLERYPGNQQEIKNLLETTSIDKGDVGQDIKYGYGVVDAKVAFNQWHILHSNNFLIRSDISDFVHAYSNEELVNYSRENYNITVKVFDYSSTSPNQEEMFDILRTRFSIDVDYFIENNISIDYFDDGINKTWFNDNFIYILTYNNNHDTPVIDAYINQYGSKVSDYIRDQNLILQQANSDFIISKIGTFEIKELDLNNIIYDNGTIETKISTIDKNNVDLSNYINNEIIVDEIIINEHFFWLNGNHFYNISNNDTPVYAKYKETYSSILSNYIIQKIETKHSLTNKLILTKIDDYNLTNYTYQDQTDFIFGNSSYDNGTSKVEINITQLTHNETILEFSSHIENKNVIDYRENDDGSVDWLHMNTVEVEICEELPTNPDEPDLPSAPPECHLENEMQYYLYQININDSVFNAYKNNVNTTSNLSTFIQNEIESNYRDARNELMNSITIESVDLDQDIIILIDDETTNFEFDNLNFKSGDNENYVFHDISWIKLNTNKIGDFNITFTQGYFDIDYILLRNETKEISKYNYNQEEIFSFKKTDNIPEPIYIAVIKYDRIFYASGVNEPVVLFNVSVNRNGIACIPNTEFMCHEEDVWWLNSCGEFEAIKTSCESFGCNTQTNSCYECNDNSQCGLGYSCNENMCQEIKEVRLVNNVTHCIDFADALQDDVYIQLETNIDCINQTWNSEIDYSSGIIGGDFNISNIKTRTHGLITKANSVVFENVNFLNLDINCNKSNCGLIDEGDAEFTNVHIQGEVTSSRGGYNVGGFIGSGNIIANGISFEGSVAGVSRIGGVIGSMWTSSENSIENAKINVTVRGKEYLGGLFGYSYASGFDVCGNQYINNVHLIVDIKNTYSFDSTGIGGVFGAWNCKNGLIENVLVDGRVEGFYSFLGGFSGWLKEGKINKSWTRASLISKPIRNIDVLWGSFGTQRKYSNPWTHKWNYYSYGLDNCYYIGSTDNSPHGICEGLSSEEILVEDSFENWDFSNKWTMTDNGPELQFIN